MDHSQTQPPQNTTRRTGKRIIARLPNWALLVAVVILIGGVVMFMLNRSTPDASRSNSASSSNDQSEPAAPADRQSDAVRVMLDSAQKSYRYGDKIPFTATIYNDSDQPRTYSFNSACTQGNLSIDDKPTQAAQSCADVITEVTVAAGEKKTYSFDFKLVRQFSPEVRSLLDGDYIEIEGELQLPPGQHAASLRWQDMTSNNVPFNVVE